MSSWFKDLSKLFEAYANRIDGVLLVNETLAQSFVIKQDFVLTYQSMYQQDKMNKFSHFIMSKPCILHQPAKFKIKKKQFLDNIDDLLSEMEIIDEVPGYRIRYDGEKYTKKLILALFNDFETNEVFEKHFNKNCTLYVENNTIMVASFEGTSKMSVKELEDMALFIDEIKDSLQYHQNRVI